VKLIPPNGPAVSNANKLPKRPVSHVYSKRPHYDRAKEAAIEKERSRYVKLDCGHMTTWDVDLLYSVWRPNKHVSFCENCGDWKSFAPKPPPVIYPDVPLF